MIACGTGRGSEAKGMCWLALEPVCGELSVRTGRRAPQVRIASW